MSLVECLTVGLAIDRRFTGQELVGRLGRQPNASYRSVEDGSLPLVAQFGAKTASNRAVTDLE
jgi:hypothetical protein